MLHVNVSNYEGMLESIEPIYTHNSGRTSSGKLCVEIALYKVRLIDCNGVELEVTAGQKEISISHK